MFNNQNKKMFEKYIDFSGTGYDYSLVDHPVIIDKLPSGAYSSFMDDYGKMHMKKYSINMSELIRFPDTIGDEILNEFKTFWEKKDQYLKRKESHKRGYLLYGPPGSGKSSLLNFMIQDFIKDGNLVFIYSNSLLEFITHFRKIEPDRKIMIIIEDIDIYIDRSDENYLLQFIDGNFQHVNTVFLATTNYVERIPARIKNRPSRFDRTEKIGMPNIQSRRVYINEKSEIIKKDKNFLEKIINDTDGFSLAHLKELILAIEVYEVDYDNIINRLRTMIVNNDDSILYEKEKNKKINDKLTEATKSSSHESFLPSIGF